MDVGLFLDVLDHESVAQGMRRETVLERFDPVRFVGKYHDMSC